MEHGPGQGSTGRTAGVKRRSQKEEEVKRFPEKVLGISNMLMSLEKKYKQSSPSSTCSLSTEELHILVIFPFIHTAFFAFFIDNSKYFPGRRRVMIWTAASAISASASWGRMRRMETILASSPSLLLSLFPPDASLFISLKILYLTSSASPSSLTQNCFLCFFLSLSVRPRLNTSYLSASLSYSLCCSLFPSHPSLPSSAGWLIVAPQLCGWHLHQSLTNPTRSPETHSSTKNSSISSSLYHSRCVLSFWQTATSKWAAKFDQREQKSMITMINSVLKQLWILFWGHQNGI